MNTIMYNTEMYKQKLGLKLTINNNLQEICKEIEQGNNVHPFKNANLIMAFLVTLLRKKGKNPYSVKIAKA